MLRSTTAGTIRSLSASRAYIARPLARPFSAIHPAGDDRPLSGIKVVDLTRILAGPTATMMMIESPGTGDDTRNFAPPIAQIPDDADVPRRDLPAESAYFLQANRNKRSITLNLKSKEGQEIVHKLVKDADVLVENYVPGKLEAFGLGYEQVRKINPKLIYCSVTGYGSTGPYASAPGYDVVIEAEAGFMHITGERDGPPVKVGVAVTDILTGHYAHSAVLAALIKRGKTGVGSRVEASLFESQIASLVNIGANYLIGGEEATRWGTSHPSIVPYQVFPCKGGWIMVSAGNNKQWAILCGPEVFNKPEWIDDPRFNSNNQRVANRGELIPLINEVLSHHTKDEWVEKLTGKGLPFAPINNIAQTFAHPQAKARKVVEEIDHPRAGKIKLAAAPVSYDGKKPKIYRAPPYLGQHTEEVLKGLGYSDAEVASLQDKKVV
ncbi:Succinate--hydroxymethylglutarate CoA-transferase [Vanrija pseudolonga]|uniref:Succinate--hydroxymethylglutarate CoA-transferase n=1 Tax=Vanrija pseudolonga TaxID=143232 RepID=A0AAF1BT86_9TREE|nr:Succinate--hydroxymethylglutarate CoA-transferase [Vanrija pseudolonga]